MARADLRSAIERIYPWALALDFTEPANIARFWYVSEAKLEPRLGERFEEDGADLEQPLAIGRDIAGLYQAASAGGAWRIFCWLPPNFATPQGVCKSPCVSRIVKFAIIWWMRV